VTRRRWLSLTVLFVLALVSGLFLALGWLSPYYVVDSEQADPGSGIGVRLDAGQPVGQTFVARHAGLTAIEFFLLPEANPELTLTLRLRSDPQAATELTAASIRLPTAAEPDFYRFSFPPLGDSHGQYLYAFLDSEAPEVSVALNAGNLYMDGAAYQANQPLNSQTSFRLAYSPRHILLDLIKAALGWLGTFGVVGLLYLVPGWALLAWLLPRGRLTWAEMLGLSIGVSLALYPLLLLWTNLVGLHLGRLYAWLPVVAGVAALTWRYRAWRPRQDWETLEQWAHSKALWPDLMLLIVLALVFGVRLVVVRTLDVPMWGDSYHHTMIGQLLVDHGGLFDSWEPYVPLKSFTYHFGFHTAVALYHWLTGTGVVDSVIVVGQIVNGLAVLSLYPLAVEVSGSRWAGTLAVLVAGLLSPTPMSYVNWGRCVQLTGQVVLPVTVWLSWKALESDRLSPGLWLLTGLAIAGLFLAHYRVSIYFILFLFLLWSTSVLRAWKKRRDAYTATRKTLLVSSVALALILPWIWHLGTGYLPEILREFTRAPVSPDFVSWQSDVLRDATVYMPGPLLIAALLGIVAGLVQRLGWALFLSLWVCLVFLAANPNWLGLPGATTLSNFSGVLNNFTVLLSLYMPVSILCGYLGSIAIDALPRRLSPLLHAVIAVAILLLSLVGVKNALETVSSGNVLVTAPDLQAMQWIEGNTPEAAKFLINHVFEYDDNVIVGSDGGWWIPLLAKRGNTVPPITYGHEAATDSDYIRKVNDLARYLEVSDLSSFETVQALRGNGITHVYIGPKGGHLPLEVFEGSDAYRLLYHKDRAWVFELQ
jgi:hypothetical protein